VLQKSGDSNRLFILNIIMPKFHMGDCFW
jgi:hypothetical protein